MEVGRRIFGLDVMRAMAIFWVMVAHTYEFIWPSCPVNLNKLFGFLGVEIFFVLSGFLIGRILIRLFSEKRNVTGQDLLHFWKRRWYRTLPNYYLCLVLYLIFHWAMDIPTRLDGMELAQFFFFLQNSYEPHPGFFAIAWSLSIEEWFYLSFPLVLMIFSKLTSSSRKVIIGGLVSFVVICLGLRMALSLNFDLNWGSWYRKMIFWRLDSIAIGVAFAWLYMNQKNWLVKHKNIMMWAGTILTLGLLIPFWNIYVIGDVSNHFLNTLFFTLISIGLGLALPYFAEWRIQKANAVHSTIEWLSKVSYSLYLIHWMVVLFFYQQDHLSFPLRFVLVWVCSLVLSDIIYRYYEVRMTALRDR